MKLSCISHESGADAEPSSVWSAEEISSSSVEVNARITTAIGHTCCGPVCGLPTPSPADPEKNQGDVELDSTMARVRR